MYTAYNVAKTACRYTVVEPIRLAFNPMSIAVLSGCLVGVVDRVINLIDFRQCIDPHCRFSTLVGIGLRHLPREIDLQIASLQYTPAVASVIFASIVGVVTWKNQTFSKAIASTLSLAAVASIISLTGLFRIGEITGHFLQGVAIHSVIKTVRHAQWNRLASLLNFSAGFLALNYYIYFRDYSFDCVPMIQNYAQVSATVLISVLTATGAGLLFTLHSKYSPKIPPKTENLDHLDVTQKEPSKIWSMGNQAIGWVSKKYTNMDQQIDNFFRKIITSFNDGFDRYLDQIGNAFNSAQPQPQPQPAPRTTQPN